MPSKSLFDPMVRADLLLTKRKQWVHYPCTPPRWDPKSPVVLLPKLIGSSLPLHGTAPRRHFSSHRDTPSHDPIPAEIHLDRVLHRHHAVSPWAIVVGASMIGDASCSSPCSLTLLGSDARVALHTPYFTLVACFLL
jgi:hypothetical protein